MSIIKEKYSTLSPRKEYLVDQIVLAQAWKKSHTYIRYHNWYADVLELDYSVINLEKRLESWSNALINDEYKPSELRLVPAPKTSVWDFYETKENEELSHSWRPQVKDRPMKLRPLAHINIQDQTIATSAMLCLANAIETLQGSTEESDFIKAQQMSIFSYGNRLQCQWEVNEEDKKKAQFIWGNSKCYRMYYEDFQQFLKRPKFICEYYKAIGRPDKKLYVLSVDLKSFYDSIDRNALICQAQNLYKEYIEENSNDNSLNDDEDFWTLLQAIFSWKWNDSDQNRAQQILEGPEKKMHTGIPQGLVAGGFFSNIYLIRFDKMIGNALHKISNNDKESGYIIRDYCRYVDDIRLVIEAKEDLSTTTLLELLVGKIEEFLENHLINIGAPSKSLKINPDKIKIQSFEEISGQSDLSGRMQMLQGALSGTPDIESLRQIVGGLDSFLQLSEQLNDSTTKKYNNLALSKITALNVDVNSDTLKRFAAKRIVDALRLQKGMIGSKVNDIPKDQTITASPIVNIDHDFEIYARKLIAVWSKNPSLSSLLKFGLDLYPDPDLLVIVIDALKSKMENINQDHKILIKEKLAAEYITADLFRSGAVWIGYRQGYEYPQNLDILNFREDLAIFAREILDHPEQYSWYTKQQASLFLASVGQAYVFKYREEELNYYHLLHESLLYNTIDTNNLNHIEDHLVTALIVQQLNPNPSRFTSWFTGLYKNITENQKIIALETLTLNRPDLMQFVLKKLRLNNNIRSRVPSLSTIVYQNTIKSNLDWNTIEKTTISLAALVTSYNNPFNQENALLQLIDKLLSSKKGTGVLDLFKYLDSKEGLPIENIQIRIDNKDAMQNPYENAFEISIIDVSSNKKSSIYYNQPNWVRDEFRWMYNLGSILRACITGEYDFTTHSFLIRHDHDTSHGYKGFRSTWYTRRFGMSVFPEGMFFEPLPLSPWVSELLLYLLQWPGIYYFEKHFQGFSDIPTRKELQKIIKNRIKEQQDIYGRLSDTPTYILPVINQKRLTDDLFRTVVVQSLLPRTSDFNTRNPLEWSKTFREKHRAHIADVCQLIFQHLKSWQAASQNEPGKNRNAANVADLIVFPELSIHSEDIVYLKRLSRATKASIFAGVCFQKRSDGVIINQAIWILYSDEDPNVTVWQGKKNMTKLEEKMDIQSYRPYQLIIEFQKKSQPIRVAAAICYDSTDLALAADLRDISDMFVISALNQDVGTFDNMVSALNYHMYQPVVLANSGEFGGSSVHAPFSGHNKIIAEVHGSNQLAISMFDIDPTLFKSKPKPSKPQQKLKTPPAGFNGRK